MNSCTLQSLSRGLSSSPRCWAGQRELCPYSPLSEEVGLLQLPQPAGSRLWDHLLHRQCSLAQAWTTTAHGSSSRHQQSFTTTLADLSDPRPSGQDMLTLLADTTSPSLALLIWCFLIRVTVSHLRPNTTCPQRTHGCPGSSVADVLL